MSKDVNSRRTFFKKAAAVVGVAVAGDITSKLIATASDRAGSGNAVLADEDGSQEKVISGKQLVLMTEKEKKRRLDAMLENYYKNRA